MLHTCLGMIGSKQETNNRARDIPTYIHITFRHQFILSNYRYTIVNVPLHVGTHVADCL